MTDLNLRVSVFEGTADAGRSFLQRGPHFSYFPLTSLESHGPVSPHISTPDKRSHRLIIAPSELAYFDIYDEFGILEFALL